MKKVAYISSPNFADCDMPLLHELQQQTDITYILELSERGKSRTLVNVKKLKWWGGVYPATDYPDLQNLSPYIDLSKAYVINMPGKHDWSPRNLLAVIRLVIFLLRHHFGILHLTWPPRYGAFFTYTLHRRMILTVHDPLPHSSEDTRLNRLHRKMAMRLIKHFILLNQCQRTAFIQHYGLREEQVFNSRLSIYTHLQSTVPVLPPYQDYVLFIGSINTHKGVEYLCHAMQQVHTRNANAKLVVAGSGKMYFDATPYLSTNERSQEGTGFMELHNLYLSDAELAGFIRHAAFVVCPYIDATQSGVIMSAFALNTPVIATDVGGLPEMVEHERHGLIVPAKDVQALSSAIERLLAEPHLLQQMRENILADYGTGTRSWHKIACDFVNIYCIISDSPKS